MDKGTLGGAIIGIVILGVALTMTAGGDTMLFISGSSALIVFGGTFTSLLIAYPLRQFVESLKTIRYALTEKETDQQVIINKINEIAQVARREGLLAIEDCASELDEPFLQKGVSLIVDGTDPELIRSILETEIAFVEVRHQEKHAFWAKGGEMAPAWGMIGTLIGLIAMLNELSNPEEIGPKMAVALITTLYGTLLANYILIPIANKLEARTNNEIMYKQLIIEGVLSVQAGENPRVIEEKLKAFLAESTKAKVSESQQETMSN